MILASVADKKISQTLPNDKEIYWFIAYNKTHRLKLFSYYYLLPGLWQKYISCSNE